MPCLPNVLSCLGGPAERGEEGSGKSLPCADSPFSLLFSSLSAYFPFLGNFFAVGPALGVVRDFVCPFPPLPSPSLRVPWARGTGEWRPCATGTPDCGTSCGEVPGPLFSPFNFPGFRIRRGGRRPIILRQRTPRRLCRLSSPACGRRKPRDRI